MKYLFWNTNKKDVDKYLIKAVRQYRPTVLALAEYVQEGQELARKLSVYANESYSLIPQTACRIKVLVKTGIAEYLEHYGDESKYMIKMLPYNNYSDKMIAAFVHLASKRNGDNNEKNRVIIDRLRSSIDSIDCSKNRRVVILGDFNLNPYESAMTYITGANAVSTGYVAMKHKKSYEKQDYYYYYNPMWNFLGDRGQTYGTFYYEKKQEDSKYWNTFDQFLLSPALVEDIEKVEIITRIDGDWLVNGHGIPAVSDHLPIYLSLGKGSSQGRAGSA